MITEAQEIRDNRRRHIRAHFAWPAYREMKQLPSRQLSKADMEDFLDYVALFYGARSLRYRITCEARAIRKKWAARRLLQAK